MFHDTYEDQEKLEAIKEHALQVEFHRFYQNYEQLAMLKFHYTLNHMIKLESFSIQSLMNFIRSTI